MIKNYLKIAFRNLQRNKMYSLINIVGLTVGLTACLLVATVVLDDLSYDHQWKNADNIYRIISVDKSSKNAIEQFPQSFTGLGPSLKKNYPEVAEYCRMHIGKTRLKINGNKDGVEIYGIEAEPAIWKVLDFKVTQGTPQNYVKGYKNLVITEKIKKQYFPGSNPIGKVLTDIPEFGKTGSYLITGVIKDIPANTCLRADVLEIQEMRPDDDILQPQGYGTFSEQYLLLKPDTNIAAFTNKSTRWFANYITNKELHYSFYLQPMKDIYLKSSDLSGTARVSGSITTVYIFSGVAVLLLVIACINFVNLTTARALKRVREAGIRKVLGASKRELIAQFLFESLVFFSISFVCGMFLYTVFLKPVETYLGHPLTLALQSNVLLLSLTSAVVLLISVLTGIYPALLVTMQNPVLTLKGKLSAGIGNNLLRKGLVVSQFTISVIVLIVTVVVQSQLHFIDNKDLGYNKNNLLHIKETSWNGKSEAFKQEVVNLSGVENATMATWYPSSGGGGYMMMNVDDPNQKNNHLKVWYINADFDFVKTMGFRLQKGRLLESRYGADAINTDSLMAKGLDKLDEAEDHQPMLMTLFTAKTFGIKNLGKKIKGIYGLPVGVINDFNNESLKLDMKPVFIHASRNIRYGGMLARIQPGSKKRVLEGLYKIWQQFFPDKVFQYDWTDAELNQQYATEHKLQQLFTLFSFLILSLAALGLFGLTTFIAELRIKEIGIRKVLGASMSAISVSLSKDFIKLVLLAVLIASPIALYFVNKWLQNYAYKVTIHWWLFVISGFAAVVVALLTISYQTIKAAIANPVKSLRSE